MRTSTISQLKRARERQQSVVLATRLRDGSEQLLSPGEESALADAARDALRSDRNGAVTVRGEEWFLQVFNPPLRMIIVGGVHIAQHLAPMARQTGYAVTLVDPRAAFASAERFPGTKLNHQWPGPAIAELAPDQRTAVVALSHDPKIDDPALQAALQSSAFYVGALGSRRTHAGRCERLSQAGVSQERLQRIHAPIGLNIAARSPAEIAVSIIAEVTETLRRGDPR